MIHLLDFLHDEMSYALATRGEHLARIVKSVLGTAQVSQTGQMRNETRNGQTHRSQTEVYVAAPALGGEEIVYLGGALPQAGPRLRTPRRHSLRLSLARLHTAHAQLTLH